MTLFVMLLTLSLCAEDNNSKLDPNSMDGINKLFMSADEINGVKSKPVPSILDSIMGLFKSTEEK